MGTIPSDAVDTHFALEQLVVSDDQLLFLGRFGDIFDVAQQLVLIQELKQKHVTNVNDGGLI